MKLWTLIKLAVGLGLLGMSILALGPTIPPPVGEDVRIVSR